MENKKIKALVLLSGGLDSILAVKLLLEQNVEVVTVNFRTNFCGPSKARPAARMLGVPLREVNLRDEFIPVLKNPKHGYGSGLNPCVDCHALMLKKAAEMMIAEGFDLVATGEVLNERPMSQHRLALKIVEQEAGLENRLLRPLSAKLLAPTIPEKEGLIDREKLEAISGRSRQRQMFLAAKFGIRDYPSPAGGCALTQSGFASRLKGLMEHRPNFSAEEIDLIAVGRHFWRPEAWLILGRNQTENDFLAVAAKDNDWLVEVKEVVGPLALVRGDESAVDWAQKKIIEFSPKAKAWSGQLTFRVRRGRIDN